ncbi:MAG: pantoate--beta-alanine ligase [Bacteroidetes bacterium]|nr:pantoate--beta-alanine ligase [Bacteroidota bacterium]
METIASVEKLQSRIEHFRTQMLTVGFVPTMGALHNGHKSLLQIARNQCDVVVLSIFVNPTQFNDPQDFKSYPLTMDEDLSMASAEGVDLVFIPNVQEMYGGNLSVDPVDYGSITKEYEGLTRKGHFDGVVAIVRKLFQAVNSDASFFGEKDLQQLAVIRRLASEEFPNMKIVGCPLVRDADGLAMSSRNIRLDANGRNRALNLSRWLGVLRIAAVEGSDIDAALEGIRMEAAAIENIDLEYVDVVDSTTFATRRGEWKTKGSHAIVAANVDGVRLIDNCAIH